MVTHDRDFINAKFREGMRDGEDESKVPEDTPYDPHSLSGLWWSRGFSYMARLLRATGAEQALAKARDEQERIRALLQKFDNGEELTAHDDHIEDAISCILDEVKTLRAMVKQSELCGDD